MFDQDEIAIDFGYQGNSYQHQRTGWSMIENGHAWSVGPESTLELPRPGGSGDCLLAVTMAPFQLGDIVPYQRVCIRVNGIAVTRLVLRDRATVECWVPRELVDVAPTLELSFEHPDCTRAADYLGEDADTRHLALSVIRVVLGRLPPVQPPQALASPAAIGPSPQEVLSQFESLGVNCELGLVQRHFAVEPLGLLRFAHSPLDALLDGLENNFAGLGSPDTVEVFTASDELQFRDTRYGFSYHTWVQAGTRTEQEIFEQEVRRLPFLRRKLVEDLEEGCKVFTYRGEPDTELATMQRLLAALRRYGDNTLLWVTQADASNPPGSVRWLEPGLMQGHLGRLQPVALAAGMPKEDWEAVCRNAFQLWQDRPRLSRAA